MTVPGMMAGQIIAGGNPIDAAKYQFMILATIAALTLLADSIIMLMVYKRCFTALDQYQPVNGCTAISRIEKAVHSLRLLE